MQVWDCAGSPWTNQKWWARGDGSIVDLRSNLCLDTQNGATANGTRLVVNPCDGRASQRRNGAGTPPAGALARTTSSTVSGSNGCREGSTSAQVRLSIRGSGSSRSIVIAGHHATVPTGAVARFTGAVSTLW